MREVARPQENQRVMYNGHKRIHSIKFQSVVLDNRLTANLHGPFGGKRHDSTILQQSGILNELQRLAFHKGHRCLLILCLNLLKPAGQKFSLINKIVKIIGLYAFSKKHALFHLKCCFMYKN